MHWSGQQVIEPVGSSSLLISIFSPENVEMQIHRNLSQERHERQRDVRGAAEVGDKEAAIPPTYRGHREEEEEVLSNVDKENQLLPHIIFLLVFHIFFDPLFKVKYSVKINVWFYLFR